MREQLKRLPWRTNSSRRSLSTIPSALTSRRTSSNYINNQNTSKSIRNRQGNERKHESRDPISFTEKGLLNKYHRGTTLPFPSPGIHRTQSLAEFLVLDFVKET
jgi:hypothetical protein